jgi:hypothetical protein
MATNERLTHIQISQTIKVLFFAVALIIAFLFALNGRYMKVDNEYYFDKWTKTMLEIKRYEIVE